MKSQTKVNGFINETHSEEVGKVFGEDIQAALENSTGKTFLQILVENGKFDLTNAAK